MTKLRRLTTNWGRGKVKTIDYRETHWGHNHYLELKGEGRTYGGPIWHKDGAAVDDVILWKTSYGHVEARITNVRPCGDPLDMFFVTCVVEKRVANPAIVSQAELDEAFYG